MPRAVSQLDPARLQLVERPAQPRNHVRLQHIVAADPPIERAQRVLAPDRVRSKHQSLHHFVADATWSDAALLGAVRDYVRERVVTGAGAPEAVLIYETGFPRQGRHSVGVARQYCGQLGKQDNCQVAVSVSVANERYSLPVGYRLYLPEEWAEDAERRRKAKVP